MRNKRASTDPSESSGRSFNPTVLIAVLGVGGTVVAALITAYFGFLTARTQVELPIEATRVAESKASEVTVAPAATDTPTATPAPAEAQAAQATPDRSVAQAEWEGLLEFVHYSECDIRVPPSDITTENQEIGEAIAALLEQSDIATWPQVPNVITMTSSAGLSFDVVNLTDDTWIELNREVEVSVEVEAAPEDLDAVEPMCMPSIGFIGELPDVPLSDDLDSYSTEPTVEATGPMKLEPGQWQRYYAPFTCEAPGIYHLTLSIGYHLRKSDGVAQTTATVICPLSYTVYEYAAWDGEIASVITYRWDGKTYVAEP